MAKSDTTRQNGQKRVFRCRNITSCQRCFQSKRKCNKEKPSCERCLRIKAHCLYFTEDQLESRKNSRKENAFVDANNILDTEITPEPRSKENYNFKLIVNSTGEYSKFFPMALFPFYEHSSNVSWVVDSKKNISQTLAVFDFNVMFKPISNLNNIKEFIPDKDIADIFVDHFFKNVYPITPIVDKEEFTYKYNLYWEDQLGFDDLNALMLLFAILFCSSTSFLINQKLSASANNNDKLSSLNFQALRIDYFNCVENLTYMLNSNITPSLSSLTSLALVYYVGSMNGFAITIQVALLSKRAQIFGLHRKITEKPENTPLRDIVYCFIWFLDSLSTYYTGLPTNMPSNTFESESLFPNKSQDMLSLFFLGRLHNSKVWGMILDKISQIGTCSLEEYLAIDMAYHESVRNVNAINRKLLALDEASPDYLKWMATETRMGLSKSFVLMCVFRHSMSYVPNENLIDKLTTDLVLQSLVLINESTLKFLLGRRVSGDSMWYNRFCFPFQAMYVVLSHVKQYPLVAINLSQLDAQYEYTIDSELGLDLATGDVRLPMVERCIEVLSLLLPVWTPVTSSRFESIQRFKKHVEESTADERNGRSSAAMRRAETPLAASEIRTELVGNGVDELFSPASSAFTFLDGGLEFIFGDEYLNKSNKPIVNEIDTLYTSLG